MLIYALFLLCIFSPLHSLALPLSHPQQNPTTATFQSHLIPISDSQKNPEFVTNQIKVYMVRLPLSLNYGLLEKYWSLNGDSRLGSDEDHEIQSALSSKKFKFPPYPENPLIKQYSAEYWILDDLMTPVESRRPFAKRVFDVEEADVVFVPFFATLSAEMQLGVAKGVFREKSGNEDYERQREVVNFVKGTEAWKRSGGRDHVFVLTDPVAMWHVRAEISPAILVVDFGGWVTGRLSWKGTRSR